MEFKPLYCTLKDFEFQSGETLKELVIEYFTMGKPKRDSEGNIYNGLLFLHGWSGDYSSFKRFLEFTQPGQPFDQDKYFIISTTALGSPGSSAPSTSSLGKDFPQYTVGDMVNAQHRLLNEHLKLNHLKGIIGTSMGGFQSLEWGVSYSDFMDFLIHLVTGPAVLGRNLGIFQMTNNIIEEHPSYMRGNYRENPLNVVKNASQFMFLFAFTIPFYHKEFPSRDELFRAFDEQGREGMKLDARDVVWRNNASLSFDVRSELNNIRAENLIIGIEGDQYFPPEIEAIPLSKSIKNSQLFIYKSELGHLGINQIEKMKDVIFEFVSGI